MRLQISDVELGFHQPFETSAGTMATRRSILVRLEDDGAVGWGEAAPWPGQTPDTIDDVWDALDPVTGPGFEPPDLLPATAAAALDEARADLAAWREGLPLWSALRGSDQPIAACPAVGMFESIDGLVAHVSGLAERGIRSIKLKIAPGHDTMPLAALRSNFPALAIGVDANGSYRTTDTSTLTAIDELGPAYLEQPLAPAELAGSARLRAQLDTPVILDESVTDAASIDAILEAGAADAITIKPGRLGVTGALDTVHRAVDRGVEVKVSGLLESSIGKAYSLAFATLPAVRWADFSPAAEHLAADVVADPWTLHDGFVLPRPEPGIGVTVDADSLASVATRSAG
jgi:O-succinylbenzoate synthase